MILLIIMFFFTSTFGKKLVHNFVSNKLVSQASYRKLKTTKNNFWKSVRQHKLSKATIAIPVSPSVPSFKFLFTALFIPLVPSRYFHVSPGPFSGISHSWKFKLVPRNFPLENGRKSPGNEIGGVWEIRELKQRRRRRRQRKLQKRNRFRWCTCITLFCTFICLHSTTRRKNAYFHKTLFLFLLNSRRICQHLTYWKR